MSGKEKTGSKIRKKNCFGINMTKLTQKWVVEVGWTSLGCMAVFYSASREHIDKSIYLKKKKKKSFDHSTL